MLIEAAVESLDAALAAVEGGAHRIELCTDLAHGGITPDLNLLHVQLPIPVFVLVRPRAGDFVYTDAEHRTMLEQISRAKSAGAPCNVPSCIRRLPGSLRSAGAPHRPRRGTRAHIGWSTDGAGGYRGDSPARGSGERADRDPARRRHQPAQRRSAR